MVVEWGEDHGLTLCVLSVREKDDKTEKGIEGVWVGVGPRGLLGLRGEEKKVGRAEEERETGRGLVSRLGWPVRVA